MPIRAYCAVCRIPKRRHRMHPRACGKYTVDQVAKERRKARNSSADWRIQADMERKWGGG